MSSSLLSLLCNLGLNDSEARIYELLLQKGTVEARELVEPSALGRGNVYNVLTSLEKQGFVLAIQGGNKTRYQACDPAALRRLLEQKQAGVTALSATFEQSLPGLLSQFALSTGKPAIQLFEGLSGIEHVLEDSLTAEGEILTIADPDAITGEILALEARYIRKRLARKIPKRVLLPATDVGREWAATSRNVYTQTRICHHLTPGFCAGVEIYDTRVSFLTLRNGHAISLLIRDPSLSALQRAQFEALWQASVDPVP